MCVVLRYDPVFRVSWRIVSVVPLIINRSICKLVGQVNGRTASLFADNPGPLKVNDVSQKDPEGRNSVSDTITDVLCMKDQNSKARTEATGSFEAG